MKTDLELLAELIEDIARDLRPEIEPLTFEEVTWNPGPQANSIGVTLWHMARGMDFLEVRVLQGNPLRTNSGTYSAGARRPAMTRAGSATAAGAW